MEIRALRPGDDSLVTAASRLFDSPAEPAVDEPARRHGIGRALVERLAAVAREAGCYGMWVVTDHDNNAARATYEGTGAAPETDQVVEVWTF